MIRMTRTARLLAVLLLMAAMVAGVCAKTTPIQEITVLAWDRGIIPPDQGTIEDNWWTRYVNENVAKLGIKVRYVPVPRAQEAQKLPTMLAAGDAPDVCFSYDKALINTYVKNGALLDFTDLVKKYGKNIRKVTTPAILDTGRVNGRIYTFVYRTVNTADTTWIRKDWLDKLGLKEPTNINELYAVLKAFKEKDPGKVGDRLVPLAFSGSTNYPFGIWYALVLPAFFTKPPGPERLFEQVYPMWPETKEAMRFMNKLYNEKLLGEFVLDKDGSIFKQKVVRGEIGAFGNFAHYPFHSAYGYIYDTLQQNVPEARLVASFAWKDPTSKENYLQFIRNSPYGYMWFSPKSAKHPDLVMKYVDWLASDEACWTAWFGVEGVDYNLVDGIPVPIDDAKYKARVPWIGSQYNNFRNPFVNDPDKYLKRAAMDFSEKYRAQYISGTVAGSKKIKYPQPWLTVSTPITDKLTAALGMKWVEMQVRIITAPVNQFDAVFDDCIKQYREAGGDEVAKELAAAYKTQYGK